MNIPISADNWADKVRAAFETSGRELSAGTVTNYVSQLRKAINKFGVANVASLANVGLQKWRTYLATIPNANTRSNSSMPTSALRWLLVSRQIQRYSKTFAR